MTLFRNLMLQKALGGGATSEPRLIVVNESMVGVTVYVYDYTKVSSNDTETDPGDPGDPGGGLDVDEPSTPIVIKAEYYTIQYSTKEYPYSADNLTENDGIRIWTKGGFLINTVNLEKDDDGYYYIQDITKDAYIYYSDHPSN
jgi:hypothetical protein